MTTSRKRERDPWCRDEAPREGKAAVEVRKFATILASFAAINCHSTFFDVRILEILLTAV